MKGAPLLAIALSAVVLSCRNSTDAPTKVDLLVGSWRGTELIGFLAAKAKGFDRDNGIDLRILPAARDIDPIIWLEGGEQVAGSREMKQIRASESEPGAAEEVSATPTAGSSVEPAEKFAVISAIELCVAESRNQGLVLAGIITKRSSFAYHCSRDLLTAFRPPYHPADGVSLSSGAQVASYDEVLEAAAHLGRPLETGIRLDPSGTYFYLCLDHAFGTDGMGKTPRLVSEDPNGLMQDQLDLWPVDTADERDQILQRELSDTASKNNASAPSATSLWLPVSLSDTQAEDSEGNFNSPYGAVLAGVRSADGGAKGDVAEKLRAALWAGWTWAIANPDEALHVLTDYWTRGTDYVATHRKTLESIRTQLQPDFAPDAKGPINWDKFEETDARWQAMKARLNELGLVQAQSSFLPSTIPLQMKFLRDESEGKVKDRLLNLKEKTSSKVVPPHFHPVPDKIRPGDKPSRKNRSVGGGSNDSPHRSG